MSTLAQFLNQRLRTDDAKRLDAPDQPPWLEKGVTVIVDEATYMQYLEVLPPRYMSGLLFAYGEGAGISTLFWQESDLYFARALSIEDTEIFCKISRTRHHE